MGHNVHQNELHFRLDKGSVSDKDCDSMNESYRLYTVKDLLELKDDPRRWIVPNMLPRVGRTFAYGRGGHYKSTILFDLAVAVASGSKLCEQFPVRV